MVLVEMEIFHALYRQLNQELFLNNNMFVEYFYFVEMNVYNQFLLHHVLLVVVDYYLLLNDN
jgi:hypothetical protein